MILPPARIEFRDGRPYSLDFRDIYYAHDGRAESTRVFIAPLQLEAMFRESGQSGIRVAELGFGTGMNFLAVSETFLKVAPQASSLDYIAFEKHPLGQQDAERIVRAHHPQFPLGEALLAAKPSLLAGWHRRYFAQGRIRLSLFYGDALEGLKALNTRCHAWLLDGFDPKRNPDMWHPALLKALVEQSESRARLATFSAQGDLRRNLASLGCEVTRIDQRPHKRHSLYARLPARPEGASDMPSEVGVVGAGFAGAFSAQLLALRGVRVHLFDAHPLSMPFALAHTRLGDPSLAATKLRAVALGYSNDWYRRLGCEAGVLEVATDSRHARQLERRAETWRPADTSISPLTADESRTLSGLPKIKQGLWHPTCHRVSRRSLKSLTHHPLISHHQSEVKACLNRDGNWQLQLAGDRQHTFNKVIVCAGAASRKLLPQISAHAIAGQMEIGHTRASFPIGLIGHGFVAPFTARHLVFGSTYERNPLSERDARAENLRRTGTWLESLGATRPSRARACWRGLRLYHKDRMPIVGEVASGLFVNTAHGSAGSTLAPLCAEVIAGALLADPPALSPGLCALMRPIR